MRLGEPGNKARSLGMRLGEPGTETKTKHRSYYIMYVFFHWLRLTSICKRSSQREILEYQCYGVFISQSSRFSLNSVLVITNS